MRPIDEDDDRSFMQRYGFLIGGVFVVLMAIGFGVGLYMNSGKIPPPKKPQEIMVKLMPPPTPPPPPPPPPKVPPPPQQPKMVEQPKVDKQEQKPKEAKVAAPPGPPGPKATGPVSDDGIGGGGGGGGDGLGGGNGSKYGWYAGEVQQAIANAMRQNSKTRDASVKIKARVWVDSTGRIIRAVVSGTSGNADVDTALKNEVLTGLQLQEPPPKDMPMPIVMMIRAQRPS